MNLYQHFGLSGGPFAVVPDPRFAYATQEHRLALVKIEYHVTERRGLFLLQGDIGTGKTTLGKFLLTSWAAEAERFVAAHINSPGTRSQAGFLRAVMDGFGLPPTRTIMAQTNALLAFLLEQNRRGKIVVLLLDEAQVLSLQHLDALHTLSNFQTDEQLLQVVLLAQTNIVNKLEQRPALRSRIVGNAFLGPLSFEDAIGMLRHRVGVVGGDFDALFPIATHKPLYNATQGVCRDLCICADAALVNAYGMGLGHVSPEAMRAAIGDYRLKFKERKDGK